MIISQSDVFEKDQVKFSRINPAGESIKFYEQVIEEEYLDQMKDEINRKKKAQFEKINKIKAELSQLLE